jgi:DNA-directed RNA polymerase specialized sigma24 family protein
MTADLLRSAGVPDAAVETVLAACRRDLERALPLEVARLLQVVTARLPERQRAAVDAELCALTPEAAARKARCSRRTIDRAVEAGLIRAKRGSTGMVVLDRASFSRWNRARTPDPSKVAANV